MLRFSVPKITKYAVFQNPKRYELQFGNILRLQENTLKGFIEIAFIGESFQPIESCQAMVDEVAVPEMAVPLCTKSLGNSDFGWLLLVITSLQTSRAIDMVLVLMYS